MKKSMFNMSDSSISQDQSLALQSAIIAFVRDARVYKIGYEVFEVKDLSTFEFCHYYSDGKNLDVTPDETRNETIDRILFTIDCAELWRIKDDSELVNYTMKYLFNYCIGIISANVLYEKHGISDKTVIFRGEDIIE